MTSFYMLVTEADFTERVITLAKARGWLVHHDRPGRRLGGWSTAIQGHAGFPDLVLARDGRVIFAELKTEKGLASRRQIAWLDALMARWDRDGEPDALQQETYLWRPRDMPSIEEVLR